MMTIIMIIIIISIKMKIFLILFESLVLNDIHFIEFENKKLEMMVNLSSQVKVCMCQNGPI